MKNIFSLITVALVLTSCGGGDQGQLVGVEGKNWNPVKPYGMTLVPGGSFIMGNSGDDIAEMNNAPSKTVTVRSYYMDETEITNSEYRQFVQWVRDSVIRQKLAEEAEMAGGGATNNAGGGKGNKGASIQDYAFKDSGNGKKKNKKGNQNTQTPYQEFSIHYDPMEQPLNWDVELIWETSEYPDEYYVAVMDQMYLPPEQSYNGYRLMDVTQFKYQYKTMDISAAARGGGNRADYIKETVVEVYPDTTVWIKDFSYSYNEPMHNTYFWHSAYDDYPVVGVSWGQAKAFCNWRTLYHRTHGNDGQVPDYRLPSEAEWEYAARGGLEAAKYPWGGPYTKDDRACFLANFKPLRGDYAADAALYTVEADSYLPNDFGLYNMAGNVSEWVNASYNAEAYEFVSSMNPNVNDPDNKRKVIRGGSWKDVSYFLQVGVRTYEYADSARSYIGFRTVQDYLGNEMQLDPRMR